MGLLKWILLSAVIASCQAATNRPVIGILAEPSLSELKKYGESYIAASYIKFAESGGARVIPIPWNSDEAYMRNIFENTHGIIYPGGGVNLDHSGYYNASLLFFNWAKEEYDNGGYYPIWGTCLGFELLCVQANDGDTSILGSTDSENMTLPLKYTSDFAQSTFAKYLPDEYKQILANKDVTLNNHVNSMTVDGYHGNEKVNSFFKMLATSKDRKGKEFAALIEGKKYPFFGSQYHPEKVLFEWRINEAMDHEYDSIRVNEYHNQFFVEQARLSNHKFDESLSKDLLIYKHNPIYTANIVSDFEQCYFF